MTERSILSGTTPLVIIRSGGDVSITGLDSDRVLAVTSGTWGLQIKRKNQAIEIEMGGNGQVLAPVGSAIIVYAGKSAQIQSIRGHVSATAGQDLTITECSILDQASAGGEMRIDCNTIQGTNLKLTAGWHLRCWLRELRNVRYSIDDLGGKWQALIGEEQTTISLQAGGDVTLISQETVTCFPVDGPLGSVQRPD